MLIGGGGCNKHAETEIPTRDFLQTRAEMLQKYGAPIRTSTSGSFSPCERLTFHSDTLSIDADFKGERCYYVRYTLPNYWTKEQVDAALASNGSGWQAVDSTIMGALSPVLQITEYTSRDGHRAKYTGPVKWLEIWSSALVARSEELEAERQQKARAIPKF